MVQVDIVAKRERECAKRPDSTAIVSSVFEFCDVALRESQSFGELTLRKPGLFTHLNQTIAEVQLQVGGADGLISIRISRVFADRIKDRLAHGNLT